jgi:hypothetical protein
VEHGFGEVEGEDGGSGFGRERMRLLGEGRERTAGWFHVRHVEGISKLLVPAFVA